MNQSPLRRKITNKAGELLSLKVYVCLLVVSIVLNTAVVERLQTLAMLFKAAGSNPISARQLLENSVNPIVNW